MKRWIVGVVLLWLIVTGGFLWLSCWQIEDAARLGDAFGAVNALFSGLAFVVVLLTLRSQERQLKEQQEEIKKQNETLARQQFEATFFQMLRLFDEHRKALKFGDHVGLEALGRLRTNAFQRISKPLFEDMDALMRAQNYEVALGPYFRLYANLCLFIESAEIEDKRPYWHLIRDIITAPEATLIFFRCNSQEQYAPFLKAIIEHRGLLYNIRHDENWPMYNLSWDQKAFEAF